jgi:ribosomal protein S18 acetylase RimI-like enzyme
VTLEIVTRTAESLRSYAAVSIAFEVAEVIDLDSLQIGTPAVLKTRRLAAPYIKDYDKIEGNHPSEWSTRFPVDDWSIFTAHDAGRHVGGAIAVRPAQLAADPATMQLWDLRVAPEFRRRGIGRALLTIVEDVIRSRGAQILCVETQDVNVSACRFYERHGFLLEGVARGAYPELPDESRLLWSKRLPSEPLFQRGLVVST